MVSGVRCLVVPASLETDHKAILAEQFNEGIPAGHTAGFFKQLLDNQV